MDVYEGVRFWGNSKKLDQNGGQGLSVEKNQGTNRSGPIVRQLLGDLGSGAGHGNY